MIIPVWKVVSVFTNGSSVVMKSVSVDFLGPLCVSYVFGERIVPILEGSKLFAYLELDEAIKFASHFRYAAILLGIAEVDEVKSGFYTANLLNLGSDGVRAFWSGGFSVMDDEILYIRQRTAFCNWLMPLCWFSDLEGNEGSWSMDFDLVEVFERAIDVKWQLQWPSWQ